MNAPRIFAVAGVVILVYGVAALLWDPALFPLAVFASVLSFAVAFLAERSRRLDAEYRWANHSPQAVTEWLRAAGMSEERIEEFWQQRNETDTAIHGRCPHHRHRHFRGMAICIYCDEDIGSDPYCEECEALQVGP